MSWHEYNIYSKTHTEGSDPFYPMPTAPLWVPVYWLGFEKGVPILAGELFVIALLCQMDKRKK